MSSVSESKPGFGAIARQGAIGTAIALVINSILFLAGSAAGAFPEDAVGPTGQAINLTAVIVAHIIPGIASMIIYYLMVRFLERSRADRFFLILAIVVLVAAVYNPFTITNAPVLQIVILQIMHLVLGGALVYFLRKA